MFVLFFFFYKLEDFIKNKNKKRVLIAKDETFAIWVVTCSSFWTLRHPHLHHRRLQSLYVYLYLCICIFIVFNVNVIVLCVDKSQPLDEEDFQALKAL